MKNRQEPVEETKSSSSTPSFSLLPDDITVNYLARIPRPYYPRLSAVSKSFHSLISSTEIYKARYNLGNMEQCLYVSTWEANGFLQWFTLWINPNPTLHDSSVTNEKTLGNLLVPIPSTDILNSSELVVGSEIYVIGREIYGGPSTVVRILDCRTHTWRDAPSMNVARKYPSSCFYDGKIYVFGGLEDDAPWAEVFNLKTQIWECLPDPGSEVRKCSITGIAEIEGKIKFASNFSDEPKTMYAYDPKQGKWEHGGNPSDMFFSLICVIENVSYSWRYNYNYCYHGSFSISWYDIKVGTWKLVKGLESFQEKHYFVIDRKGKLVSCGGKLLLVWEERWNDKKIWCAVIKVEKRDGGEVWGQVEWDDGVLTIPSSRSLLHCLSVSV